MQLDELVWIRQAAEDPAQRREQVVEAGRSVDRDRRLPAPKRERLEHPRQTEVVIGVVVREEDLG